MRCRCALYGVTEVRENLLSVQPLFVSDNGLFRKSYITYQTTPRTDLALHPYSCQLGINSFKCKAERELEDNTR